MATENRWRARKIQAELSKLCFRVSLATISRYLPNPEPNPSQHQRWMTFLRNHRDLIAGMDFFVVPTVRLQLLYVWFVLDHGRRRVLHFNVTVHPTARWVVQQVREAFPGAPTHRLDHVVILGEDHLIRLLRDYVEYYNAERVHTSIGDAPEGRSTETRPSTEAKVIGLSRVGGLHHKYAWASAA